MATVSNPVIAWTASIMAGSAVNQSSSLTATVNITAGWEVQVPVACRFSNVSADPVISFYRSTDGGANYDNTPMSAFSINRVSSGTGRLTISLPIGQYAIQMLNSGPNTATFQVLTQVVITAINNV